MIWNLLPLAVPLFIPKIILNIIFVVPRILTLWIEVAWNSYFVMHVLAQIVFLPYYVMCFFVTLSYAMDQRTQYKQNNEPKPDISELFFELMGWEGMPALEETGENPYLAMQ